MDIHVWRDWGLEIQYRNGEMRNEKKMEAWMIGTSERISQIEMGFANGTVCEVLCEKMGRFESVNMENGARCSWGEVKKEITEDEIKSSENRWVD